MTHDIHIRIHLPHLPRAAKIIGVLVAVAALSGGIAVAASPGHQSEGQRRAPSVNAPNVVTQTGYVSLAPCRVAYTPGHPGPLGSGAIRTFQIGGTSGFAGQGGTSTGCGVPVGASAVALEVTTTHQIAPGYLTFYATGTGRPVANQTAFTKGQTTTTLVNAPVNAGTGQVDVYTNTKTDIVLDVAGYYREPIAAHVNANGSLNQHSSQVTGSSRSSAGAYTVTFDQTVSGCAVEATAGSSFYSAGGYSSGSSVYIFVRDFTATNQPYADSDFFLTVTC